MIDKLPPSDILETTDLLGVYVQKQQDTRRVELSTLLSWIESSGEFATSNIYDPESYTEQADATYIYFAWARVDGTGYLAKRRELATASAAGTNTGPLPIPPDLTVLIYS